MPSTACDASTTNPASDISFYERLLSRLALPREATLGLVMKNGQAVVRIPFDLRTEIANIAQSNLFAHVQHASSGSIIVESRIDRTERLSTYQVVGETPFIVFHARATSEIFAEWRHLALSVGLVTVVLCGFKAVFIWQLRGERLRRVSAEHHARLSAQVLATVNRDLEGRIQQEVQSREQACERLASSQRLDALGQLAGGIAHDINNVLQTISGACSMLQMRNSGDDSITRLAGTALSAADRGSAITRRLLVFARRAPVQAEAVDVLALLSDLQELLNHTLFGSVVVELDLAPNLPRFTSIDCSLRR